MFEINVRQLWVWYLITTHNSEFSFLFNVASIFCKKTAIMCICNNKKKNNFKVTLLSLQK